MFGMKKRFSELNPFFYWISVQKETLKRHLSDVLSKDVFAKEKSEDTLPQIIASFQTNMIKRAPGVDLTTQVNKAENIRLASANIHGMLIRPGETFSFWHTVGNTTRRKGYKEGRVLTDKGLVTGLGGGLCNLSNSLNRIVLHSPLTVTEFRKHSDALAPDSGNRIPLAAGTSVSYNYVDYRFKNETDQTFQLMTWCEGDEFFCELRAENPIPFTYELVEEDRHFRKEGEKFYHYCKLYRVIRDQESAEINKELIWDNRSKVMYDPTLIPTELIRE